jgi:hypothetical protein
MKYEAFVRSWQKAKVLAEVARAQGMHPLAASRLASRLRKRGIPLKTFTLVSHERIDVDGLSRVAREEAA